MPMYADTCREGDNARAAALSPDDCLPDEEHMQEQVLRDLIDNVRAGRLPRRSFVQQLLGLGIAAPMASMLLLSAGLAQTGTLPPYKPQRRGGGGTLKLLAWEAPVLLNPHFAAGLKDQNASRIFYEPLATFDEEANLVPVLAAEIPSREAGTLSADGKSVIWKLKRGVIWHDGLPFTADDVVFTARYVADPATAAVNVTTYRGVLIEKVDSHTVRVTYPHPTPFWAQTLVATPGLILPQHVFADYIGARSRECPANLKPVGTGPYKFVEFKPGDWLRGQAFAGYHLPNRPHFDAFELKGGGDAISAARAVLQTGEYDYAAVGGVDDEILQRLEGGGKGKVRILAGNAVEFITLNHADPWTEVEGERAHPKSRHPAFRDKPVRDAMALLIDRQGMQDHLFGRTGAATPNFLVGPPRYVSKNLKPEFSIAKANQTLDAAGWKKGADGIRAKAEVKLKFVFQAATNPGRQKIQTVIKDACTKAGIELELKPVVSAVFFGSDAANPDTFQKFWADMQMYVTTGGPDPQRHMERYCSWDMAQKANKWAGRNVNRWSNPDYDAAHLAAQSELDPVKRVALFIKMNDIVCSDHYVIPLAQRPSVVAVANKLSAPPSGTTLLMDTLAHWYKDV